MARKRKAIRNWKNCIKGQRLLVFISSNFNDRTKSFLYKSQRNFSQENKNLLQKSAKDIVLEAQWIMMQAIFTKENLKEIFWWLDKQGAERQPLYKI